MIKISTAIVYKAPLPGAPRRLTLDAALNDWARRTIRQADCRGGKCYEGTNAVDDPSETCDRHMACFGLDDGKLFERVKRILKKKNDRC